jgi:hypothetical protein
VVLTWLALSRLLEEELLYEEAEVMQRLRHWTRGRLQDEVRAWRGMAGLPPTRGQVQQSVSQSA